MNIVEVLMSRDGMSEADAKALVEEAKADLYQRLDDGEMPDDICEEYFSLEPDFLMDLL